MITLEHLSFPTLEYARDIRNRNRKYFVHDKPVSKSQHGEWFTRVQYKKGFTFYIIKLDGINVGTISVYDRKKYYEIGNVIIEEKMRGKGLLRKVFQQLVLTYSEKPYKIEVLYNNINALKAYQKLGFEPKLITLWM